MPNKPGLTPAAPSPSRLCEGVEEDKKKEKHQKQVLIITLLPESGKLFTVRSMEPD